MREFLGKKTASTNTPDNNTNLEKASEDHFENSLSDVERIIGFTQDKVLPTEGLNLKEHLMDIEKDLIDQALKRSEYNVSQTARLLGLQRTTLIEKINKHGLQS